MAFPKAIAQSPIKPEQCNLTRFVVENFLKSVENFREDCGKVVESLGKNSRKDKNFEDRLGLAVQAGGGFSGMDHGLISLMRSPITLYPSFAVLVHLSIEFAQARLELNPIHHGFCWEEPDFFDRIS